MPAAPKSRAGAAAAAAGGPNAQTVRDTATDSETTQVEGIVYLYSGAEYRALPGRLQFTLMAVLKPS